MYSVAQFVATKEVDIVPSSWIFGRNKDKSYWPDKWQSKKISAAVTKQIPPESDWGIYDIKVMGEYQTYQIAYSKCKKAEDTSNIDTGDEEDRRPIKKPRRYINVTSDEESEPEIIKNKYLPAAPEISPDILPRSESIPVMEDSCSGGDNSKLSLSFNSGSRCDLLIPPENGCSLIQETPCRHRPSSSQEHFSKTPCRHRPSQEHSSNALMHLIMKKLVDLEQIMINQNAKIEDIRKKMDGRTNDVDEVEPQTSKFPITSFMELKEYEKELDCPSNFKKACHFLSMKGGKDVGEVTRRILKTLLDLPLAAQMNWAGKGDKAAFRGLTVCKLVSCAVRKNQGCATAQDREIDEAVKNFLKHAPAKLNKKI